MRKYKHRDSTVLLIVLFIIAAVFFGAYLLYSHIYLPIKTEKANARYAAMYKPEATPTAIATEEPSPTPTIETTAEPTAEPTVEPTAEPTAEPIVEPTAEPTTAPTAEPEMASVADATAEPVYNAEAPDDIKLGTPGPDTVIYLAPTLPPVQESFAELIRANPETAGFLRMADGFALPVVQRAGDNEFYLNHDFEGNKNNAGCLFVDGMNLLYPRDKCIYIYGHNMKNGTMFGELDDMSTVEGLVSRSPVRFDSIYECGVYVPFACFELTADMDSRDYFEIRHFDLDAESYAEFVTELKRRSVLNIPIDAMYGDDLLILVTCSYNKNDGRFAVAFRKLREGETEEGAIRLIELAVPK